tara:strand:+ start:2020 stop:2283 length:264 start_codon:yes stop_codon:yes gene_type:complete
MNQRGLNSDQLNTLIELLERRLEVIGDEALRDSDPDEQLSQLKQVSEAITVFHKGNEEVLPNRLKHFLESCSFAKALDWAKESLEQG